MKIIGLSGVNRLSNSYAVEPCGCSVEGCSRNRSTTFTPDKPIIFNFHGYPWLIHKLAYRFDGHQRMHVRGYKEKGNINTPLELAMLNETSRFHLVIDVIDRVPSLGGVAGHLREEMRNAIIDNMNYAHEQGTDRPEVANWTWPY